MDISAVYLALCNIPENKRQDIITRAVKDYAGFIAELYNDIYESCIKVYYSYKPKKYKRHGDIVGFNLYSGFASEVTDLRISASTYPEELLPYRKATREEVLNNVMNGQRGSVDRNTPESGVWPKRWIVQYPNSYSEYSLWSSKHNTIDGILRDFQETIGEATAGVFWEFVAQYI